MLDVNASMFFMRKLDRVIRDKEEKNLYEIIKRTVIGQEKCSNEVSGSGVGPHWRALFNSAIRGDDVKSREKGVCTIRLETRVCVENIVSSKDDKKLVRLSNGHEHECDLVISAIGVRPNIKLFQDLDVRCSDQGGVEVDVQMRIMSSKSSTSFDDVYAAGDVTCVNPEHMLNDGDMSKWFQMRLWSQARLQGMYAARYGV